MNIEISGECQVITQAQTKNYSLSRFTSLGDVEVSLKSQNVLIFFPLCHSVFMLTSKKSERLDIYRVLILPPKNSVDLTNITHASEFCVLEVFEPLLNKVKQNYAIEAFQIDAFFQQQNIIPRNNWLNEVICRLNFEHENYKSPIPNAATEFLDAEVVKEAFFLHQPQEIIAFKDRVNLDSKSFGKKSPILKKAIAYIDSNLIKNIDIQDISQSVGASGSSLQRAFSESLQMTIGQFITQTRLDRALVFLSSQQVPTGDVAYQVGFKSQSSFIKAFKARYGLTPSEVKKESFEKSLESSQLKR